MFASLREERNPPEWEDVADMAVVHLAAATAAVIIMGLLGSIFQ